MPSRTATRVQQTRCDNARHAFHVQYCRKWGEDRWFNGLSLAMTLPTRFCALVNQFVPRSEVDRSFMAWHVPPAELSELQLPVLDESKGDSSSKILCLARKSLAHPGSGVATEELYVVPFPRAGPAEGDDNDGRLFTHWNLDYASVLAAHMLHAKPGDKVLDMCAAPGGKSLALAQALWPYLHSDKKSSELHIPLEHMETCLHCNEFDSNRNKRLQHNLEAYLPHDLFKFNFVEVTRFDGADKKAASLFPLGEGGYDKVLLDAPCSSERHIIHADQQARDNGFVADEMMNWKANHTKTHSKTQLGLLMTALHAVKIGGRIVYATCSISDEENDLVIERALEAAKKNRKKNPGDPKHAWQMEILKDWNSSALDVLNNVTEPTRFGRIALPDHPSERRWGPLYMCVIQKQPYTKPKLRAVEGT